MEYWIQFPLDIIIFLDHNPDKHIQQYTPTCTHMHARTHACTHARMHTRMHAHTHTCTCTRTHTPMVCLWPMAYGVVVSMFDFHCSDRGSNPGRGSKISCLRLHYRAAPLASVWKTISHGFTEAMWEKLGSQMGTWRNTRLSYSHQ